MKYVRYIFVLAGLWVWIAFSINGRVMASEIMGGNESTVTEDAYNIMLLIDKSGSMHDTDPEGMAKSAACQFVDQLCETYNDLAASTYIGVMAFSRSAEAISSLTKLGEGDNAGELKSQISNIVYDDHNTGGTDLGTAIYEAAQMLQKQSSEESKKMIVMFTDGYSEKADKAISEENREKALEIAKSLGSDIYIVGLNHGGKIEEEGKEEIYYIADSAQVGDGIEEKDENDKNPVEGMVNYLITDSMGPVRNFYGKIYAKMRGSVIQFTQEHQFSVVSAGVYEADVTVYSDFPIRDVVLIDPDNNSRREDGETLFGEGDDYYKVVKIKNPQLGTWTVSVTTEDESYQSYVIQFYGIEAAVKATWGDRTEFGDAGVDSEHIGQLILTPMFKGEPYRDDSMKENFKAEFEVCREQRCETFPMHYEEESGKFVGFFGVEQGKYHIIATLSDDNMKRVVECDLYVNGIDPGVVLIGVEEPFEIRQGEEIEIELSQIKECAEIEEPKIQKAETETSLIGEESTVVSLAKAEKDTTIIISGEHQGMDKLQVEVTDRTGTYFRITADIQVIFKFGWSQWSMVFVAFFVLAGIMWLLRWGRSYCKGEFVISIVGSKQKDDLERIVDSYPRGRKFSLWKLIGQVVKDCNSAEAVSEEEKRVCEILKKEKRNIVKRKLVLSTSGSRDRRKRTYKIATVNGHLAGLVNQTECYQSDSLRILLRFQQEQGMDEDWGLPIDFNEQERKGRMKSKRRR